MPLAGDQVRNLRQGHAGRLWQSPGMLFQLQGGGCSALLLLWSSGDLGQARIDLTGGEEVHHLVLTSA